MTSSDGKNGEAKSAEAEAKADNEDDDDAKEPEPQQEQPQEDIKQTIAARLQERLQQVWTLKHYRANLQTSFQHVPEF